MSLLDKFQTDTINFMRYLGRFYSLYIFNPSKFWIRLEGIDPFQKYITSDGVTYHPYMPAVYPNVFIPVNPWKQDVHTNIAWAVLCLTNTINYINNNADVNTKFLAKLKSDYYLMILAMTLNVFFFTMPDFYMGKTHKFYHKALFEIFKDAPRFEHNFEQISSVCMFIVELLDYKMCQFDRFEGTDPFKQDQPIHAELWKQSTYARPIHQDNFPTIPQRYSFSRYGIKTKKKTKKRTKKN